MIAAAMIYGPPGLPNPAILRHSSAVGFLCREVTVFCPAMHDLNYFREHLPEFEKMAANRGVLIDFEGFRALDRERRERITAVERR